MVNNEHANLSRYSGSPPGDGPENRHIEAGGPLYDTSTVLELLNAGEHTLQPWTRKCIRDMHKLSLDHTDMQSLVRDAITIGRYRNSEWCQQRPAGPWAACDAYQLLRNEWIPAARREMRCEYYVKFAIGKTGKLLLLVSCHLSEDRG